MWGRDIKHNLIKIQQIYYFKVEYDYQAVT